MIKALKNEGHVFFPLSVVSIHGVSKNDNTLEEIEENIDEDKFVKCQDLKGNHSSHDFFYFSSFGKKSNGSLAD